MSPEARKGLRAKKKAGMLPPQTCPSCKADLSDPGVPEEYAAFREMFGLAREVVIDAQTKAWVCPVCSHLWQKHPG